MASIAEINGLTIPASGGAFLLDQSYASGAAAAYSVRRLSSSTGALIRVRRVTGVGNTGNDDEADFRYDSNNELSLNSPISNADTGVNSTTLGSFLNVGTVNGVTYPDTDSLSNTAEGYCDSWYDQSGNSNDATQSTSGNQPQIHDGTVNTDLITENGKPALDFDGSAQFPLSLSGLNINNLSAVTVCQSNATSGSKMQFTLNTGGNHRYWHYMYNGDDTMQYGGPGASWRVNHGAMDTNQRLRTFIAGSTSTVARSFLNGTQGSTTPALVNATLTASQQVLGNYHTSNLRWNGTMQEFIVWGADQFNNRSDIENNMNSHFQIY